MATLVPFGEKTWPGLLGLADEDDIREISDIPFLDGDVRAADHGEHTTGFQLGQDLAHPPALHVHAGNPDNVRSRASVEIDRFDILVDERDAVLGRGQRRHQRQTGDRQHRLDAQKRHCVLQPPVRNVKTGVYQNNIGHAVIPAARRPHSQRSREATLASLRRFGERRRTAREGTAPHMAARRRSTVTCRPP